MARLQIFLVSWRLIFPLIAISLLLFVFNHSLINSTLLEISLAMVFKVIKRYKFFVYL